MTTTIITIGNSQGVRIPKLLLEESGLKKDVVLRVKRGKIIITPAKKKRAQINFSTLASEDSLSKDWLRREEDEAWKDL